MVVEKKIIKFNMPLDEMLVALNILAFVLHPVISHIGAQTITAVCFLCLVALHYKMKPSRYIIGYLFFFFFCAISIIWAPRKGYAMDRIIDVFVMLLFIFNLQSGYVKYSVLKAKERYCEKMLCFYLSCVTFLTLYLWIIDWRSLLVWARLGNLFYEAGNSNLIVYSCYLCCAVYIAIWKTISTRKEKRIFSLCIAIFLFLSCILTGVRKIVILPLIFVYVYYLYKYRNNALKIMTATCVILAFSIVILLLAMKYSTSFSYRVGLLIAQMRGMGVIEESATGRALLRKLAWKCFKENPILGYGVGNFRYYSVLNHGQNAYAHCNWLEILSCMGIVGFILYYGNQFIILKNAYKSEISFAAFSVAFIISEFACDIFQVSYYNEPIILMFALLAGISDGTSIGLHKSGRFKIRLGIHH